MTNYFAPDFQIEIDQQRLATDVSRDIQDLIIKCDVEMADSFSFSLINPLPAMRWTHTDDWQTFKPGSFVKVRLGYVNELTEMMVGEITKVKPTFPGSGIPIVTIECSSLMNRLQRKKGVRASSDSTLKDRIMAIAQDAGLDAEAEDIPTQKYDIQANETDFACLSRIAKKANFDFLVQGKTLIFRHKLSQPKELTLIWYGVQESFSPAPDTMPLISFAPTLSPLEPAVQSTVRSYDPCAKKAMVSVATYNDQGNLMGGSQPAGQIAQNSYTQGTAVCDVRYPAKTKEENDARTKTNVDASALKLLSGSAETIGNPELWAGKTVSLRGVGKVFDGRYYIKSATHTLNASGYRTSINLQRNAQQ